MENAMGYIDAHCHLYAPELQQQEDLIVAQAKQSGVLAAVVVAETTADFQNVIRLSDKFKGFCFPCLGVHPVQGDRSVVKQDLDEAISLVAGYSDKIVGIGEVGLDYTPWVCKSQQNKDVQQFVLAQQIELAQSLDLPLNIHSRSAAKYVLQVLKDKDAKHVLLHNFAGKRSVALEASRLGYYMSFPPNIIHKPERSKMIEAVPMENIMLETDSPALGPYPQEPNVPSNIILACKHVAKVKGLPEEIVAEVALQNTQRLFANAQFPIQS